MTTVEPYTYSIVILERDENGDLVKLGHDRSYHKHPTPKVMSILARLALDEGKRFVRFDTQANKIQIYVQNVPFTE